MSNIHGLSSLKGNVNTRDDFSDSNDEEHRQGFYVGGSDHSGQQVLGPPDAAGSGNNDVATRLFDAARHAGAEQISPEELNAVNQAHSSGGGGGVTFSGGTYRLGGHGQPSESILKPTTHEESAQRGSTVNVNFNVWEDGFSIDDGPLRGFNDPESRPFLESISRGQIPTELVQQHPGRKVDFHMIRKNTPYVAPKAKPFSGQGYRLGSVVPNVIGGSGSSEAPELVELDKPSDEELAELLKKAQEAVGLRDGAPTTRVQIRLPAGSGGQPMVGTFNHDHTVMDLRTFIVNAQPTFAFQPFQLLTLYPTKIIENESDTLKNTGLLNAVQLMSDDFGPLMPPTLKEFFMIDKLIVLRDTIKKIGGVRAAIKQRYLMDQTRAGDFIGEDKFGNKYYQEDSYFMPRNRYVVYPDRVWLDYDGSQVPPEWHRWLHHTTDHPPTLEKPVEYKWMLEHRENKSLELSQKYVPYSTTRPKIQAWEQGKGNSSSD